MDRAGHRLVAAAVVCLLVAGAMPAGALADVDDVPAGPPTPVVGKADSSDGTGPTNESTVRHRDPEELNRPGRLADIQRWLSGRMEEALVECTRGAVARQIRACSFEEYPSWVDRYIDVAGETADDGDDEAAPAFERADDRARTFTNRTRQFRQTRAAYREAREYGFKLYYTLPVRSAGTVSGVPSPGDAQPDEESSGVTVVSA